MVGLVDVHSRYGILTHHGTEGFLARPKSQERPGFVNRIRKLLPGSLKDTFCPFETWLFPPK